MSLMSRIGEMFSGGFGVLTYYSKRFIAESKSGEVEEVDLSAISSTTLADLFPGESIQSRQYDSSRGTSSSDGRFRLKY